MKLALLLTTMSFAAARSTAADQPNNQQVVSPQYMRAGETRRFSIEYVGKVPEIPANTKSLRLWIPVPRDSTVQKIDSLSFSIQPKLHTEPKYGNTIAYWEFDPPKAPLSVTMRFTCERKEIRMNLDMLATDGRDNHDRYTAFRTADKLVLVDEEMRKLSMEVVAGKQSTLEKARAIYDYVLGRMTYDKNHAGWGLGSTRHACDVGKGNCTDFHALFNSLCRAQGIASGFEIGLYLPYRKGAQEPLGGYHCWAFFRVPGKSWVPVDCSEADRFSNRREYFFGSHTSNRVTLSTGRDIMLEPAQQGEPLNYFLNPYAEADGGPIATDKSWSFNDL